MSHIDFNQLPELDSVRSAAVPATTSMFPGDIADIIIAVITGSDD